MAKQKDLTPTQIAEQQQIALDAETQRQTDRGDHLHARVQETDPRELDQVGCRGDSRCGCSLRPVLFLLLVEWKIENGKMKIENFKKT